LLFAVVCRSPLRPSSATIKESLLGTTQQLLCQSAVNSVCFIQFSLAGESNSLLFCDDDILIGLHARLPVHPARLCSFALSAFPPNSSKQQAN